MGELTFGRGDFIRHLSMGVFFGKGELIRHPSDGRVLGAIENYRLIVAKVCDNPLRKL